MWTPRPTVNPRKPHGGPHEPRGPHEVLFYLTVTFEVTLSGTLGSRLYFTARQEGPRAKFSNDPTSHDPYTLRLLVLTIYGGRWDGIVRARRGWMKYPGPCIHPLVTSSIHVRTSSAESPRTPRCGVHNVEAEYFKAWPAPIDSRVAGPRPRGSRTRQSKHLFRIPTSPRRSQGSKMGGYPKSRLETRARHTARTPL